jgi:hypothetical protein
MCGLNGASAHSMTDALLAAILAIEIVRYGPLKGGPIRLSQPQGGIALQLPAN